MIILIPGALFETALLAIALTHDYRPITVALTAFCSGFCWALVLGDYVITKRYR